MKTREQIIHSLCITTRHDYGLLRDEEDLPFLAGMTKTEQQALYRKMAQLYDNNIADFVKGYERYAKVRTLNVFEFAELYSNNIKGVGAFDDLLDNWVTQNENT